jgi:hypothetical protein
MIDNPGVSEEFGDTIKDQPPKGVNSLFHCIHFGSN